MKRAFNAIINTSGAAAGPAVRAAGFTLTEVLVVLGVVALLIGLLLPVLASARRSAYKTACAANLREIASLAGSWAASHDGHLPLDGQVHTTWDVPTTYPALLGDPNRRRYDYLPADPGHTAEDNPGTFLVAMLRHALGPQPGAALENSAARWARDVRPRVSLSSLIECPGVDRSHLWSQPWQGNGLPSAHHIIDGDAFGWGWLTTTDYATNGGLLGFHHDRGRSHRAYRGHTARIGNAATLALAGDGDGTFMSWTPTMDRPGGRVTLADVLGQTPEVDTTGGFGGTPQEQLDVDRHGGRANVAFADGHVAAVAVEADALSRVDLLQD